jgi:hypothetical protein
MDKAKQIHARNDRFGIIQNVRCKNTAAILRSLKETSINNEELGMYWKENSGDGSGTRLRLKHKPY